MLSGWAGTEDKSDNWPFIIAVVGRFIYGIGGDPLSVAHTVQVARWVKGNELAFAFSLSTCMNCFAYALAGSVMPALASSTSLGVALTFGSGIATFSFI